MPKIFYGTQPTKFRGSSREIIDHANAICAEYQRRGFGLTRPGAGGAGAPLVASGPRQLRRERPGRPRRRRPRRRGLIHPTEREDVCTG
jgi:hypothetical protein